MIAQTPLAEREASRLMALRREGRSIFESRMKDLPGLLRSGDCLVLNDTRVTPCKFFGRIAGRPVELLVVQATTISETECDVDAMVYPGKRFKVGVRMEIATPAPEMSPVPAVSAEVTGISEIGRTLRLRTVENGVPIQEKLKPLGVVPLPPYITNPAIDPERYQTCFARDEGSTAAPTAGLHFTPDLFRRLSEAGIRAAFLTLHVGPGTFRPVTQREIDSGQLHPEPYRLEEAAAQDIRRARDQGGRVVAVGTTVCRTLEHIASKHGEIRADRGVTDLFIREGFKFRAVDALLTNFHLPRTSLLMLVSAFGGHELLMNAYREAVRKEFRFYSFGDAMLIL